MPGQTQQRASSLAPETSLRPQARPEQASAGAGNAALQDVLNDRQVRATAVSQITTWLSTQQAALEGLAGDAKVQRTEAVLSTLRAWWTRAELGETVDFSQLPASPTVVAAPERPLPLPPELIGEVRPLITALEAGIDGAATSTAGGPEGSAHTATDWNTTLGVPEYRTQSDNLVGPEATCNTTTLSMVLERLGIGRDDVVRALEDRLKRQWIDQARRAGTVTAARASQLEGNLALVDEEEGWDRDAAWKAAARRYLDAKMLDRSYQRVRGQSAVSGDTRDAIAGEFRADAQMEDVLDMLVHHAGISRYSIVSEPDRVLDMVSNTGLAPTSDKIWGGASWGTISERVQAALESGGAAALSFHHKGTRQQGASHIVSIQEVQSGGLVVDDPYGQVRATYNPRAFDDAYFHADTYQQRQRDGSMVTKERVIHERSVQKNQSHGFDDWGAGAARTMAADETKGDTSFMGRDQVTRAMKYITLFQRGQRVPLPRARPEGLGQ